MPRRLTKKILQDPKFQCGHCCRTFLEKCNHRCDTGFRKHKHSWIDLYPDREKKQKEFLDNLVKATNMLAEARVSSENYIVLDVNFIQKMADKKGIPFEEMVKTIKTYFNSK